MKHFGMAYAMKKKHGAHMCHGGECDHPSHFAEGGSAENMPIHSSRANKAGESGQSAQGSHVRYAVNHDSGMAMDAAKGEAKHRLEKQREMKKPNLYAEGGSVLDDTHRWENEKGINKVASGDKPGRSEAGASLHPAFSIGEDMDKAVAKRRHHKTLAEMRSMPKPKLMAEGGEAHEAEAAHVMGQASKRKLTHEDYMKDAGYSDQDKARIREGIKKQTLPKLMAHGGMIEDGYNDEDEPMHPMIEKIMMGRAKGYSEGGKVANEESGESSDEPTMAKWDGNEFDDLALRDDLEFDSTGENSGDHEGDEQEDHDKADIIARVMKSRSKKDRMPRPA